ncbi:hypothetical protein PROVRUST_04765, partial [Providencia rustigianii DSM 4541]
FRVFKNPEFKPGLSVPTWLPHNDYAKSKIEVIDMVIHDLEQLQSKVN